MPDAFDILGLPPTFDLTVADVRAAYLTRVRGEQGGAAAVGDDGEAASALNAAKTALSDAETRANLLLARLGGPPKETYRELPDGFLMAMMEAREELEAASANRDAAGIDRWKCWAEQQRDGHIARVRELFNEHVVEAGTGKKLLTIRRELNAWRYIERMLELIEAL